MNLKDQVRSLESKCLKMRESLEILRNPPKYPPGQGLLEPLDFLRHELKRRESEQEQAKLLEQAEQALVASEAELERLKGELATAESEFIAAANQLRPEAENLRSLAKLYAESLLAFHENAMKVRTAGQSINRTAYTPMELTRPFLNVVIPAVQEIGESGQFRMSAISISDLTK